MNAVSASETSALLNAGTTGTTEGHEVQTEAKNRLSEILSHLQDDLQPYVRFELQELAGGKEMKAEEAIIDLGDLKTILYEPSVERKELRRIIASIRHRARAAQTRTEQKLRETERNKRRSAVSTKR
jgi:hypothetical protein